VGRAEAQAPRRHPDPARACPAAQGAGAGRGEGAQGHGAAQQPTQPWTPRGLETMFHRARAHTRNEAGLPLPIRIHDLRGTYVTWLATKGLTDEEIGRVIGWKPGTIAEVHHRYVNEARVVISQVERLAQGA